MEISVLYHLALCIHTHSHAHFKCPKFEGLKSQGENSKARSYTYPDNPHNDNDISVIPVS